MASDELKKIVKHGPRKLKTGANIVFIKSNTPFVSSLKRVAKILARQAKQKEPTCVIVYGLGKAISNTVALAMELMISNHEVQIRTRTADSVDEHLSLQDGSSEMKIRHISYVELKVRPPARRIV